MKDINDVDDGLTLDVRMGLTVDIFVLDLSLLLQDFEDNTTSDDDPGQLLMSRKPRRFGVTVQSLL